MAAYGDIQLPPLSNEAMGQESAFLNYEEKLLQLFENRRFHILKTSVWCEVNRGYEVVPLHCDTPFYKRVMFAVFKVIILEGDRQEETTSN